MYIYELYLSKKLWTDFCYCYLNVNYTVKYNKLVYQLMIKNDGNEPY